MKNFLKNYFSTILFIVVGYMFYTNNSYYNDILFYDVKFLNLTINTLDAFNYLMIFYFIVLIPFYLIENEDSKARVVINAIIKKIKDSSYKITPLEKNSILGWLVKFFFIPLMLSWTIKNGTNALNKILQLWQNNDLLFDNFRYFFDNYLFLTIYGILIFIDVFIFAIGYLVESKYLNNKIKSVEPTIFGWVIALICYPPFNESTEKIFGWYSETFPAFSNTYLHIVLNTLILISFAIYVWASIALGFKASNLTNRGIVAKGPYKYVRHPAYFAKNFTRALGALPIIILSIKDFEFLKLFLIVLSTILRFTVYYFRAITEENHLNQDKDYQEYKKKVKYKFIPKVF